MSRSRWVLSVWLLGHVTAVGLTGIPSPEQFRPSSLTRSLADPVSANLAPHFDAAAGILARLTDRLWRATGAVRRISTPYVKAVGSLQQWRMFWNPSTRDEYLRVTYHVRPTFGSLTPSDGWTSTELVLPAHPVHRVRGVSAYRNKPRDKAISSAINRFFGARSLADLQRVRDPRELPDALLPVSRYFARRFSAERLAADEELTRIELWFGSSPNPEPGAPRETSAPAGTVEHYYHDESRRDPARPHAGLGATETESDIRWTLIYFEQP